MILVKNNNIGKKNNDIGKKNNGICEKITKEIQDLLSSRYPRLSSHSTYSLPRNTRLYKSCKRFVYILPKIHCIFE